MNGARLPLAGIRVIDLSRVLAGPVCGALLGDKGADVIKVEDVEGGNESRHWAPQREGHSPVYVANNRNKRSIAVDLKAPEGRDIVAALIDTADVLIENFGTGAMERLGLGYDTLAARNPRLVYCSIAAFGRQGPRADEAGYEALMQAFSGVMSITGEPGRPPVRCGVSALDIFTGTLAGFAVSNAILMRQTSGVGQRLDASLFDSAVGLLNFQAQNYLLCGQKPAPWARPILRWSLTSAFCATTIAGFSWPPATTACGVGWPPPSDSRTWPTIRASCATSIASRTGASC